MFFPHHFSLHDASGFLHKLTRWVSSHRTYCLLNSNNFTSQNLFLNGETKYNLLAVGITDALVVHDHNAWNRLKVFYDKYKGNWMVGHLTYDLKNETENLSSGHADRIGFPLLHFFVPRNIIEVKDESVTVYAQSSAEATKIFEAVNAVHFAEKTPGRVDFSHRVSKMEYISSVKKIIEHIKYGDIYELNYCMEFFAGNANLSAADVYTALNSFSPAPFSVFYKYDDKYLMSASPERFLAKRGEKVFSQPIKGTIKRGKNEAEDQALKHRLQNDKKERSENIMIVDLVRNDLSRSCVPGSVVVEELCGIYTFPHVHQMISTISGQIEKGVHPVDVIKNAFPMGSMTGAPKIRAMELIEQYEITKRGLYSGSIGYFNPAGDFDFNVVIRSLQYNQTENYLSLMAGSAITALSDPEKEYEECLLKAEALMAIFKHA